VGASALAGQTPPPPPSPALVFEEDAVVAGGLTRGGRVLWFGIGRTFDRYALTMVPFMEQGRADQTSGEARLEIAGGVPEQSIFFVADLETGAYAVAAPAGYEAIEVAFPADGVSLDRARITLPRYTAEVALVRP
jgi:hypothetical protein